MVFHQEEGDKALLFRRRPAQYLITVEAQPTPDLAERDFALRSPDVDGGYLNSEERRHLFDRQENRED